MKSELDSFEELTSSHFVLIEAAAFEDCDTAISAPIPIFPMSPATGLTKPYFVGTKTVEGSALCTTQEDLSPDTEEMASESFLPRTDFSISAQDIVGFCNLVSDYHKNGYGLVDSITLAAKSERFNCEKDNNK